MIEKVRNLKRDLTLSSTRASFMKKLQELLEDDYEDFESLENVEKSSSVLGIEL